MPALNIDAIYRNGKRNIHRPIDDPDDLILESWSQGLMVGSLLIMAAITTANMRRGVLLHKLIFLELILAMPQGTFIFVPEPAYGWYLAATTIGLIISWNLHNVVAWMKNRPFLSRIGSIIYIGTVALVQPYWVLEIYANFTYFNNINQLYLKVRPWEPLFRDPWWIYTTCSFVWVIKTQYSFGFVELVRQSPRFGIMLVSMCLTIIFIILDILSVTGVLDGDMTTGINPFWKLCFIFKCLCDTIILDDFKTALDKLRTRWFSQHGGWAGSQLDSNETGQSILSRNRTLSGQGTL
ncbi:hypothetical protein ASPWEDRAFT_177668 [Aspergillus wentii DTO 134E9]|uniref:Uncharacterized protein n=1 Tax=Aspergillus wentii DTO 134E9 TaxID=1073089 RepID=A0A1L9R4V4_ASPWE|nr:uncharacterized protein ASPWEDRAFT_177668 [Aspergillus wentii DTO 134E9]KAI9927210.1 hypothetical protein MW887_003594 [Aspergillus wentii]OJJ29934.1 hypothetical protein ASPWEDRAFT_177668 [Aspergillus wentii DTO 134E9]